eukprot:XP_011673200.1 PREDICTED: uncharacterized protein LOC105442611 [Strongylocentrotus purpuratus]
MSRSTGISGNSATSTTTSTSSTSPSGPSILWTPVDSGVEDESLRGFVRSFDEVTAIIKSFEVASSFTYVKEYDRCYGHDDDHDDPGPARPCGGPTATASASVGKYEFNLTVLLICFICSKHRRFRPISKSMIRNVEQRLEVEEENAKHLSRPFLTKEEEYCHAQERRSQLREEYKTVRRFSKAPPNRYIDDHLAHLRISRKWE